MVNNDLLKLLVFICLFISYPLSAQEPVASIDRSVISVEDTLTLTIHIDDTGDLNRPDTSPLEKDFEVLGTSQSSRHSFINGRSESSTEWTISLLPKRTGTLNIPSIKIGDKNTQRLTVTVQRAVPHSADNAEPIFLESDISADRIYLQQQLIFTVRVFQSVQLDNMSLSEIDIDNALVEKLSQNSFQRRIGNRPYRVHEIRYAIFPQRSGTLTIPEVVFSANEATQQQSFFSLPGQGRPVRRMTQQHDITVLPPPADFPQSSDNPWLPAEDIRLEESWSIDPTDIKVGDSVTRTLTIRARGLLGTQLPPYQFKNIEGARFYPDQGQTDNSLSEQGASSTRVDSTAIIPTKTGTLQIPAVTLNWWDTRKQELRQATIPARTIEVKPAPADSLDNGQPLAVDHSTPSPVSAEPAPTANTGQSLWQWLTVLFAGLWCITLCLWWASTRRTKPKEKTPLPSSPSEKQQFHQLLAACRNNDATAIRTHMIAWTQTLAPHTPIHSLYDVQRYFADDKLSALLGSLDNRIYGAGTEQTPLPSGEWISLLKTLRKAQNQHDHAPRAESLPPLYNH